MVYEEVDKSQRISAYTLNLSVQSLTGFLTTLIASNLVDYIQLNGNMIFGISVYEQQITSLVSAVVLLDTTIFLYFNWRDKINSKIKQVFKNKKVFYEIYRINYSHNF